MKNLNDLFMHFLQDVYYAEHEVTKALPKMSEAASGDALKQAFTRHRQETEEHVRRLDQVFEQLGAPARAVTCEAMQGLIEESKEVIEGFEAGPVRDAGLLACAQAVEHYEISRYGALIAWAKEMSHQEVVRLLETTLEEEKKTDTLLIELATRENVNGAAAKAA